MSFPALREVHDLDAVKREEQAENFKTPLLSICKPAEIRDYKIPPGYNLLGPGYVRKGDLSAIIGQGGVGKSRVGLLLAISQITDKNWCGIPTGGDPQKWLLIGNEKSRTRQKMDYDKIFANLSEQEQALVEEFDQGADPCRGGVGIVLNLPPLERVAQPIVLEGPVVFLDVLISLAEAEV